MEHANAENESLEDIDDVIFRLSTGCDSFGSFIFPEIIVLRSWEILEHTEDQHVVKHVTGAVSNATVSLVLARILLVSGYCY